MACFACDTLAERGIEPVLAWYEPYSQSPELSVPAYRLLCGQRVGVRRELVFGRYEGYAIGAWLPELEFTHYRASEFWRQLIESCRYYLVVSGNCLAGHAFMDLGLPFLGWIATPWAADRDDRAREFPLPRRMLDRLVNGPALQRYERRILRAGTMLALSRYTERELERLAGKKPSGVLSMPVDDELFHPAAERVLKGTVGFSGRFSDPRKNIGLLLQAIAYSRRQGSGVTLDLIGENNPEFLTSRLQKMGLTNVVRIHPFMERGQLPQVLQRLDVFVVPSHQEGLCIAALEAMACGCPVLSTRCGGPEEYVVDGETGYLVGSDAAEMGETMTGIVCDRALRARLSKGAYQMVAQRYSPSVAREQLLTTFNSVYDGAVA